MIEPDTETIVSSFFHALEAECEDVFKLIKRRAQWWDQFQGEQPALFCRHVGDHDDWSGEDLPLTTVEIELVIYSEAAKDPDAIPDAALSACVKAVRTAVSVINERGMTGAYRCRIEGHSSYDPGDLDQQSKATIPVRILVPSLDD